VIKRSRSAILSVTMINSYRSPVGPPKEPAAKLAGLDKPLTKAEREFCRRWESRFPKERWGDFMHSWVVALRAFDTPITFTDGAFVNSGNFRKAGRTYIASSISGGNSALRRELTAKQKPYVRITKPDHREQDGCALCGNVAQAQDADAHADQVRQNAMFRLGGHILQPNRYPNPLHCLILPVDHDDTRMREPLIKNKEGGPRGTGTFCAPMLARTRGDIPQAAELEEQYRLAHRFGLVTVTNHVLSGMSIPAHRHSHAIPLPCYPPDFFDQLCRCSETRIVSPQSPSTIGRSSSSPYELLIIRGPSLEALCDDTAAVLAQLEMNDQVFASAFVPSSNNAAPGGCVIVAPLRGDVVADYFIQVGGAIAVHGLPIPYAGTSEQALYDQAAPTYGEFDWPTNGVPLPRVDMKSSRELTEEYVFSHYSPVRYPVTNGTLPPWGCGDHIATNLTPLARKVFQHLRDIGKQDLRGDPGHAEVVAHFTATLANLMGLDPLKTEANVLAAIVHDAGWGVVEDIEGIWNSLATRRHSDDAADAERAANEMARLRFAHEQAAAQLTHEHLKEHPLVKDIATTVLDHDTRAHPPLPHMRPFYDGDWLWRVSVPCRLSRSSGNYDRADPEAVYRQLQREFKREDFMLPWAYTVARIEAANTVRTMHALFDWTAWPDGFEDEYRREIALLEQRYSA
jgi:hypothetical protein